VLAQVSQVTRRPRGGVSLKPSSVTADSLRFGRGTANEVLLQDVRVGLSEAVIQPREGVLYLTQVGTNLVRLNGQPVAAATVKPGDEIQIGPFKVTIVDPPEGADVAVTVELIEPLGDDFARLQEQSRLGLDNTWLDKRGGAWIGVIAVLVLFLLLPVIGYVINSKPEPRAKAAVSRIVPAVVDSTWNVGEISNPHKNFANQCRTCHETAFIQVRDSSCLACHNGIQHHFDTKRFPTLVLDSCGSCHQEHRGARGVITQTQSLCTDCHADLKRTAANADLRNVTDFGSNHPEFAVTLVANAAADKPDQKFRRVALGGSDKPVDNPGMKFSHRAHLPPPPGAPADAATTAAGTVAWPKDMRRLGCADCHQTAPGGGLMKPVTFERNCAECHAVALRFAKQPAAGTPAAAGLPQAVVPHGDAALAQRVVADYYAGYALRGGFNDDDEPAPAVVRRRPGTTLTDKERQDALDWAHSRTQVALQLMFDKRACGTCHEISRDGDAYKIAPLLMQEHFLPKAQFNHAKHASVDCAGCHAAATSISSADVLIPGIESCRTCHGGEAASVKVQSTCISCHGFHNPGTGPMLPKGRQTANSAQ
jgi:predicted CXXCH cytochrome family protein